MIVRDVDGRDDGQQPSQPYGFRGGAGGDRRSALPSSRQTLDKPASLKPGRGQETQQSSRQHSLDSLDPRHYSATLSELRRRHRYSSASLCHEAPYIVRGSLFSACINRVTKACVHRYILAPAGVILSS